MKWPSTTTRLHKNLHMIYCFLVILVLFPMTFPHLSPAMEEGPAPWSDLNIRFSTRPLTPPESLLIEKIPLPTLSVARPFVAPAPQAVIFETDQRHRIAILSKEDNGSLVLFRLEEIPLDPKLPGLVQCAQQRGCAHDRTPHTGGLGCVALCLKEILEASEPIPPS